ncbi:hypothetical protein CLOBOL_00893 [Enterocloster bolteae ATCC BAA-613]|jgi:hypothetical protein|uniref:Uncharacterized protein n=1 Tax=Enterocloster bolteae (strain ATCC BAA-613 / DSM 15670 / CCUG 46953 / JCM 12243 / WAL 16351) TaxID=411902 RepID=A8RJE6_ENTBW|nr:hypothetical protein CLOBOL_00893 [Enterocloster bolteae ATCC BAA-613]
MTVPFQKQLSSIKGSIISSAQQCRILQGLLRVMEYEFTEPEIYGIDYIDDKDRI